MCFPILQNYIQDDGHRRRLLQPAAIRAGGMQNRKKYTQIGSPSEAYSGVFRGVLWGKFAPPHEFIGQNSIEEEYY